MWIERSACPFRQLFMLGVVRIADCPEEVLVSREAADILGWTSSDGIYQSGRIVTGDATMHLPRNG